MQNYTSAHTKKVKLLQTRFAGDLVDKDDAQYELITYDMISETLFLVHILPYELWGRSWMMTIEK
jgi:hypothetical protein